MIRPEDLQPGARIRWTAGRHGGEPVIMEIVKVGPTAVNLRTVSRSRNRPGKAQHRVWQPIPHVMAHAEIIPQRG